MKKVSKLFILFLPLLALAAPDHIIFTEVAITPYKGEYIQIQNPTAAEIDMSNYYLTDAVDTAAGTYYYNLPSGTGYHSGLASDFTARFPAGYKLAAGASAIIAVNHAYYYETYGDSADLAIKTDFRAAVDGVTTIGSAPSYLDDTQESLVLFYWDGSAATVKDVDYLVWGSHLNAVDKSGISSYSNDTPVSSQSYLDKHVLNQKFKRTSDEGSETASGGNGLTGHDETSEIFTATWQIVSLSNTKPKISSVNYNPAEPTTENSVTISCAVTDDSSVAAVDLIYTYQGTKTTQAMSLSGSLYSAAVGPFTTAGSVEFYIRAADITGLKDSTSKYIITISEPEPELTMRYIRDNWDEYEGKTVTLSGVISIGSNILYTTRTQVYLQDKSGSGVQLFDYDPSDLERGDSLDITGTLTEYNSVVELTDWTSSYTIVKKNCDVPAVDTIAIAALNDDPTYYEGSFFRVHGTIADRTDATGGGSNIVIEDETGRTTIRVWNTTGVIFDGLGTLINAYMDSLLSVGNEVIVGVVGSVYSGSAQVLLGYADDATPYVPGEAGAEKTYLKIAPYPFVPQLGEILNYEYEYPSNSRVILRVYDSAGRYITTLVDQYYAVSWRQQASWDGRDILNRLVAPGVYLFHLETTNRTTGKTLTQMRPAVVAVKLK